VARDLLAKLFRADDPLAASSQTIAVMHLVDGMTLEEVAREAGMSVSGVRKRLRSVRARLEQLEGAAT
jgi:RNA polymerase sigma-70 factor (ECF subfamily)